MSKAEAGRIGGLTTYKKYGRRYMSEIGQKGAEQTHRLYRLQPINNCDFVYVSRETGVPRGKTIRGLKLGG